MQRPAVAVNEVATLEQLAAAHVEHFQCAGNKLVVHHGNVSVERLVAAAGKAQYQTLSLEVNLPGTLVAELTADEARITLPLVVVHLAAETKRRGRKGVPILLTQALYHTGHHLPVVTATEQLLALACTVVQLHTGVQDTRIHNVLPDALRWKMKAATGRARIIDHRALVNLVVLPHPAGKPHTTVAGIQR